MPSGGGCVHSAPSTIWIARRRSGSVLDDGGTASCAAPIVARESSETSSRWRSRLSRAIRRKSLRARAAPTSGTGSRRGRSARLLAYAKSGKYTRVLGKQGVRAPPSTARYDVRGPLGGAVYRAGVVASAHEIALKALPPLSAEAMPFVRQRFDVVARARHPNLVALYELQITQDASFLDRVVVDGIIVMAWLSRERPNGDTVPSSPRRLRADLGRLRSVMRQVADGLHALHDLGLRHDNLK